MHIDLNYLFTQKNVECQAGDYFLSEIFNRFLCDNITKLSRLFKYLNRTS